MQTASSTIWSRVAVPTSYDQNYYITWASYEFTQTTKSLFKQSTAGLNSELSFS